MLLPPKSSAYNGSVLAPPELSEENRKLLLAAAHDSIINALDRSEMDLNPPSLELKEPRGVFTTLYLHGALRGCVGYVIPIMSLYRAVVETARSAAFEDMRFTPVERNEAPELEISLSVLSSLREINPDQVVVGCHGLLISQHGKRGLLLPQVPMEHKWDRITFLEQTCRKAGLPPDAWMRGARVECFTAEVFCDAPE